jgi:hypothetical protein
VTKDSFAARLAPSPQLSPKDSSAGPPSLGKGIVTLVHRPCRSGRGVPRPATPTAACVSIVHLNPPVKQPKKK